MPLKADLVLEEKLNTWAFWWGEKHRYKGWMPADAQAYTDLRYTETTDNLVRHLDEGGYRKPEEQ